MEFTSISPRQLNTDIFSNKDTLSKAQLSKLVEDNLVQVFKPEQLQKFISDAKNDIEKSEDSEKTKTFYESQLKGITKHQVDGKILFLKAIEPASKSDDLQKGELEEEVIHEFSEDDLQKGHVAEAFTYGKLSQLTFPKKGDVVKEELQKTCDMYKQQIAECKAKMAAIAEKCRFLPNKDASEYMFNGMKSKCGDFKMYPYGCTEFIEVPVGDIEPYPYTELPEDMKPKTQEEAELCRVYNMVCRKCIEFSVDCCYLELFKENIQDNQTYKFNLKQLAELGIEKGEEDELQKAVYSDTPENRKLGRVGQTYGRGKNDSDEGDKKDSKRLRVEKEKLSGMMQRAQNAIKHFSGKDESKVDQMKEKYKEFKNKRDKITKELESRKKTTYKGEEVDFEKGIYKDTPENRKLGRVGQTYGGKKKEEKDYAYSKKMQNMSEERKIMEARKKKESPKKDLEENKKKISEKHRMNEQSARDDLYENQAKRKKLIDKENKGDLSVSSKIDELEEQAKELKQEIQTYKTARIKAEEKEKKEGITDHAHPPHDYQKILPERLGKLGSKVQTVKKNVNKLNPNELVSAIRSISKDVNGKQMNEVSVAVGNVRAGGYAAGLKDVYVKQSSEVAKNLKSLIAKKLGIDKEKVVISPSGPEGYVNISISYPKPYFPKPDSK